MKIVPFKNKSEFPEKRFAIADDSGKILDDAQGYGYKSQKSAEKVMWYRFKGGKEKIKTHKKEAKKKNKEVNFTQKDIDDIEYEIFRRMKDRDYDENEFLEEMREIGLEFKYDEWFVKDPHKWMLYKINEH